ncbi:hypothetical protein [Microcoleus anatoxicus]|uniref:Uncharacterized protein n=1 Tax=Microcoleus anatoxicus PTRS2 TaxID=2705321 RepID=A0ABU8YLU8_9CYAN
MPILPKYFPNFIGSGPSTPINFLTKPGKIEPDLAVPTRGRPAATAIDIGVGNADTTEV